MIERTVEPPAVPKSGKAATDQAVCVPVRMCLVCRELKPRDQLFRLVRRRENGSFAPNTEGRIPGKGIYFCRDGDCIERLHKERRLRRQLAEKLEPGALEWMLGTNVDGE